MHRECDEIRGGTSGKAVGEDSDIMMFVPSSALEGVAKFGFQNLHTTGTSLGAKAQEMRYSSENTFNAMVLGYGSKSKEVLPKYAALDIKKEHGWSSETPHQYGDVVFVMKNDVKSRTSWTPTDSLGFVGFRESKTPSTLKFKEKEELNFKCHTYCEAQIWGPLDYSDVEYAMIAPDTKVPKALKTANIPVYFYEKSQSSVKIKKGKIAYKAKNKTKQVDLSQMVPSNHIEKAILDIKTIGTLPQSELIERYNKASSVIEKRNLLGQIALSKNNEAKIFLMKEARITKDEIARSDILLGLSVYGHDKEVRALFKDFIESKTSEVLLAKSDYSPIDLVTALAIISDTEGFKDDKELKDSISEEIKNHPLFKRWYARLFLNAPLCKDIDVAHSKSIFGLSDFKLGTGL